MIPCREDFMNRKRIVIPAEDDLCVRIMLLLLPRTDQLKIIHTGAIKEPDEWRGSFLQEGPRFI